MIEYVISVGEGTLYDYGVLSDGESLEAEHNIGVIISEEGSLTVLAENCSDDCETGK
jgi:hypothetical protein